MTGGGWEFDVAAIQDALDRIGLRWPVEVRVVDWDGEAGSYATVGRRHSIIVSANAADPDGTLWHELAHARQAERGDERAEYIPIPDVGDDLDAYLGQAHEIEAETFREEHRGDVLTRALRAGDEVAA